MNPFMQGWSASHTAHNAHPLPTWGTRPSVYGALPYHTGDPILQSDAALVTFTFTSFDATVLNSVLVGPDGRTYFYITTDPSAPKRERCTVVADSNRGRVGIVTWGAQPTVGIDELGWTLQTSHWLCLSPDQTCRNMVAGGQQFTWRPNGGCIELLTLEKTAPQLCARISQGPSGTILQLTPRAIQSRLLQVVVVSAVLLMSGRSID
ncbi:hypothetical protein FB451DRAFT_643425 [Mycena latifolia]|nr:hypothetical protein FB451DRAFT_643425 [Mycena latifolia]